MTNSIPTDAASITSTASHDNDIRQRFYFDDSPVRGDAVRLSRSYASIIAQKDYPESIKRLLGEMLTAASLLIGTLKIEGRLSIQLQSSDENSLLNWAMAECDNHVEQNGTDGHVIHNIRGLASWKQDTPEQHQAWQTKIHADEAFSELGEQGKGVLFINIQPANVQGKSQGYQGIVERCHNSLAGCLEHYQQQSAQIDTIIKLSSDGLQAGGIILQKLPLTAEEQHQMELAEMSSMLDESSTSLIVDASLAHSNSQESHPANALDTDLWRRLSLLTNTIKDAELTTLNLHEILYRLYHEEEMIMPESIALEFGCTCSQQKCESAIIQLGEAQAMTIAHEQGGSIEMDCGFCGSLYRFDEADIEQIFAS